MQVGKLPPEILIRLLAKARQPDEVIVGPAYGEDAAAISFGEKVLVAAADPVTFATDRIGYYAVSVNANDVAAHGARPRWFLATVLLPKGSSEADVETIFDQVNQSCEKIGVALIGGHTEITPSVNQVVVSGCMFGEVDRSSLIRTGGARVGDVILLAGGVAVEGAAILAREAADDLLAHGVHAETVDAAKRFLDDPGICVVDYAMTAMDVGGVSAMHDPTEGGLATALRELAAASKCGIQINRGAIHVLPECHVFCEALGLDPLGLIASGCLLITCDSSFGGEIVSRIRNLGVPADVIGEVVEARFGLRFENGSELPVFDRDEIARYFDKRGM
ncbi:MAG: AIR synthase family protein [Armatimonadetes bacterium]|nr:AIR synthase family protein [Armatimonadota bacterium]